MVTSHIGIEAEKNDRPLNPIALLREIIIVGWVKRSATQQIQQQKIKLKLGLVP